MSPEHVSTIRRNQERAVKLLYRDGDPFNPNSADPERVSRETLRRLDEMEARASRQRAVARDRWLIACLWLVVIAVLLYWVLA